MPATPITDPVTGESLVGTEPQLLQQLGTAFWRQRLNMFTGRTLSVDALSGEQLYRGGLLATLGQSVTAGTVTGLALTLDPSGADPLLVVTPGYGITANGEDVVLNSAMKTRLSTLAVIDSSGNELYSFHQLVGDSTNSIYAGILLLQPVIAQVSGQLLDTGGLPAIVSGNLGASCSQDPAEYAFEDWQIADAVRLVYFPWPAGVPSVTNLQLPPMEPQATWRNRLAYAIFEAESLLGPDDQLPWAMLGLPVAMIAFDPGGSWTKNTTYVQGEFITDPNGNLQLVQTGGTSGGTEPTNWSTVYGGITSDYTVTWMNNGLAWKTLFVDCSAVVRAGGLPRQRYVFPALTPPVLQRQSNTAYAIDEFIVDSNNNVQTVQIAGTTGGPPPIWKTGFGQTTVDGSVTWNNNGPASWQPNAVFSVGQFIFDPDGNMEYVLRSGISGATQPEWNGVYLPTTDNTVTWVNNGSGTPPLVQSALAQARVNQLSEQLSQVIAQQPTQESFNLASTFSNLPPSGIVPAAALNFANQTAPWFPPNWTVTAAPVYLEELETALETGTMLDPIPAETSAPTDSTLLEPVEILVPLPDALYDPNILVQETVAQVFYDEVDQATEARNLTLQQLKTVQDEINSLLTAVGPNVPSTANLIDPDAGLTPGEIAGRNAPPPYAPSSTETFGTVLQSTWQASSNYSSGQFVIDGNGNIQVAQATGTSGSASPTWNTNVASTTTDNNITWLNNGPWSWQPNTAYVNGQFVVDPQGFMQTVQNGGTSASAPPAWLHAQPGQTRTDNTVTWQAAGKPFWQPNIPYAVGQVIVDANGNIESVQTTGTSGASAPTFDPNPGQTTKDAGVLWNNLGHATWQPNTQYSTGQTILDSDGNIQIVTVAGISASSLPVWLQEEKGESTQDGIVWQCGGNANWEDDYLYAAGQLILDANKNVQIVQTGGISGDSPPAWNLNLGQTTQDSGVVWQNLGHSTWQPGTLYSNGQAILDSNGSIQIATVGGTSGTKSPAPWSEGVSALTFDVSVTWQNSGPITWQPSQSYVAGQIIVDSNGNLEVATVLDSSGNPQAIGTAGTSGKMTPTWSTTPNGSTSDGAITWEYLSYESTDLAQLNTVARQEPYTTTFLDGTGSGTSYTISLLSQDDLNNLQTGGLQTLITSLNARISQANDLLDTAFLTAQTDIYRFRENVLGATAATTLATSTVLANIATGETATATAENLQSYLATLSPSSPSTTTSGSASGSGSSGSGSSTSGSGSTGSGTTSGSGSSGPIYKPISFQPIQNPVVFSNAPTLFKASPISLAPRSQTLRSRAITASLGRTAISTISRSLPTSAATLTSGSLAGIEGARLGISGSTVFREPTLSSGIVQAGLGLAGPTQIVNPGQNVAATSTDITSQSPIAGAQLNLRTLTIAERLQQSPSQEAMFYGISNRLSFLEALQALETDLNLVADDLPILMDGAPPAATTPPTPVAVPVIRHTFSEWLGPSATFTGSAGTSTPINASYPNNQATILQAIQSPYLVTDSAEATLYSVGVRVVEQHTMLLRALEARVQQYSDFVGLCTTALNNIQSDIQQAQAYASSLQNNLLQDRQNVAFTSALLADETQRVQGVNAQRLQILQSSVQLVAYTRVRTLEAIDTVPSRQLVPANVTNPVPACLQQSVSIPPELREIVGQLREAPLNWLPSASSQVSNLERPSLLQELALSTQARAAQQLQLPLLPSSAAGDTGAYATAISNIYSANQQNFRSFQTQRAAIQPAALANLSWSVQVASIQSSAAVNDLIAADSVHTEVSNAVARLIQQISSVATCLYTRVSIALPADRLAWAQYLSGAGISVQLQSLAILPNWNQMSYTDRQQMQMLVDWLFLQIDATNSAATAFMSDVVRTAILLASDVPIDNIIPGNILVRTLPTVGGVVTLNLPSERVSSGMYVNLYSGATLAARGVVSDLDTSTTRATVTDVFTPGTYLETSDTAHFTTLAPQAVALRPLFM